MPHKPSGGQGVGAPQPQSSTPTAASLLRARTEPPRQPAELAKKARARIRGPIGGSSTGVPTNRPLRPAPPPGWSLSRRSIPRTASSSELV